MAFEPKVNIDLYTDHVRTIEAHTSGEYCRVALDCPETKGNTMIEKKHYLEKHHDDFRTMLMHEPRGHHDMFGAIPVSYTHLYSFGVSITGILPISIIDFPPSTPEGSFGNR